MDIISLLIGVAVGIVLFLLIYLLILKKPELISEKELDDLRSNERSLSEERNELKLQLGRMDERAGQSEKWLAEQKEDLRNTEKILIETRETVSAKDQVIKNLDEKLREQKDEINRMSEQMKKDFELLANRIFEAKSETFTKQNKFSLEQTLAPLKEKLQDFEKKVDITHKDNIEKSATLIEQIKNLKDLNEQMSADAKHLTEALKGDSKTQGNWGELVLEKVLERSGLKKGEEYILQGSDLGLKDEHGKRYKPDVIILLPDDKQIIIDSKVSLTAYERLVNADSEEDKRKYTEEHVRSVKAHIVGLSDKQYHHLQELRTPDFTLMFLPVEASFSLAVQADYELFNFAWDRKIVIVSPTTLFATLRTIASIWKQENQQRNAQEIARQGGALYDKFVSFVSDLRSVGQKIDDSRKSYDDAMNKLIEGKGNLIRRVERLGELGSAHKKQIPKELSDKADPADYSLENH